MKYIRIFIPLLLVILFSESFLSCGQKDRQVVPIDIDADEVFRELMPNDDGSPENLTFGKNSIPGLTLTYEMESNDTDVYVSINKLTLLDVNPKINESLFDCIAQLMKENEFLPTSFEVNGTLFAEFPYSEATDSVIAKLQKGFANKVDSLPSRTTNFNFNFEIYPVYLNDSLVTYRLYAGCYTGGAHGQTFSYLISYDLVTGEKLTLKDIVKPEGLSAVREEVVAHMAYSYPIYENITTVNQYLDSLNSWLDNFSTGEDTQMITVSDFPLPDPAITREGLAFIYQMYELTPGSDGCPLIVIPYRDIKGCLNINP